jgi:enamine deaminase RidA (YjgF/YER057c/UK114 family)
MAARQNIFDGTESAGGYARAVRVGPHIHVSGTTALDKNGRAVGRDAYEQTREIYRKIDAALVQGRATLDYVVRITAYITDMSQADGFLRAHKEVFHAICPAAALIGCTALLKPELIVEIEAYAIIPTEADALFGVDTRSGP